MHDTLLFPGSTTLRWAGNAPDKGIDARGLCNALQDGRRPDAVAFTRSLLADLARRDFTCNAIAVDVLARRLLDPLDGVADASAGILRAVGEPEQRLVADGLRVWRAFRFLDAGGGKMRILDASLANALRTPAVRAAAGRVSKCGLTAKQPGRFGAAYCSMKVCNVNKMSHIAFYFRSQVFFNAIITTRPTASCRKAWEPRRCLLMQ